MYFKMSASTQIVKWQNKNDNMAVLKHKWAFFDTSFIEKWDPCHFLMNLSGMVTIKYNRNNSMWFSRLGQKNSCSFHLGILEGLLSRNSFQVHSL